MKDVAKMTGRDRAIAAMRGENVDRVPTFFYRHFPRQDDDNTVGKYVNWARSSGTDMLLIQIDGYWGYPLRLSRKDVNDLKNIERMTKDSGYITGQVDRAKRIADALQGDVATFYLLYMPFALLKHSYQYYFGRKMEDIMWGWRENWPIIENAMKYAEEAQFILMEQLKKETAIDGLFLSMQHGEYDRFTREEYRSLMAGWDRRMLEKANSLYEDNVVHLCSYDGIPNNLDLWQDYDYKTVNWGVHIEKMSLAQGREFFKPGSTLMGGFDNRQHSILYSGTKEQVKDYTKGLIDEAGERSFIISADCSISNDTPDERIHWVTEAAEEYGRK